MKKLLLLFLLVSGLCQVIFAQTQSGVSRGMNYQAVAYDAAGKPLPHVPINIKISFCDQSTSTESFYTETHLVTTNESGVFAFVVGEGANQRGQIVNIPWSKQKIWLNVEMASASSKHPFNLKNSTQIQAVPYAFHAQTAAQVLEQDHSLEKAQSIYWHTGGNTTTLPATHFLGTRDAKNLVFKTNNITNAIVTSAGQVQIYGRNTGSDTNMDNYPLLVTGSKQGIYIKVNGSRNNDNNFVTFADDVDKWGEIQGQTTEELEAGWQYQLQVALFALKGASLATTLAATIAQAAGLNAAATAAGVSVIFSFAAPGFLAAGIATIAKAVTVGIEAAALLAESITWSVKIHEEIGVEYASGSGDYAEWLERSPNERDLQFAEIVGVKGGLASLNTRDADHVMVVSSRPIVLGNMPQPGQEHKYEKVAFMGQVPVRVSGKVNIGDYILASGNNDGMGIAKHPSEVSVAEYRNIVGVAWEAADDKPLNVVKIGVGLNKNDLAPKVEEAAQKIDNIIAFLEGKGPLRPENPTAIAPTSFKTTEETTEGGLSNAEFDALVDSQEGVLKDFYGKLAAQLKKQGADLSQAPELEALFNDPAQMLKKMRRDPAFKAQWKIIDQKIKSTH